VSTNNLWVVTEFWQDDDDRELQGSCVIGVFNSRRKAMDIMNNREEYCEMTEVELNCERVSDYE
jgi:hypothetical protein